METEITSENKAKVFAHYLGQPFKVKVSVQTFTVNGNTLGNLDRKPWDEAKLLLKPLSSITTKQLIKVVDIYTKGSVTLINCTYEKGQVIFEGFVGDEIEDGCIDIEYSCAQVIDFLRSEGYDLPNYHLNGQTLKSAGLASYSE